MDRPSPIRMTVAIDRRRRLGSDAEWLACGAGVCVGAIENACGSGLQAR